MGDLAGPPGPVAAGRAGADGTPSPVEPPDVPGEAERYGGADPALLALPLDRLPRPLLVESAVLGERIYLVADEGQAAAVKVAGLVTYTAPEVRELRRIQVTAEGLRAVHDVKRAFPGRVVPEGWGS